jgi:hypothetical protein
MALANILREVRRPDRFSEFACHGECQVQVDSPIIVWASRENLSGLGPRVSRILANWKLQESG